MHASTESDGESGKKTAVASLRASLMQQRADIAKGVALSYSHSSPRRLCPFLDHKYEYGRSSANRGVVPRLQALSPSQILLDILRPSLTSLSHSHHSHFSLLHRFAPCGTATPSLAFKPPAQLDQNDIILQPEDTGRVQRCKGFPRRARSTHAARRGCPVPAFRPDAPLCVTTVECAPSSRSDSAG